MRFWGTGSPARHGPTIGRHGQSRSGTEHPGEGTFLTAREALPWVGMGQSCGLAVSRGLEPEIDEIAKKDQGIQSSLDAALASVRETFVEVRDALTTTIGLAKVG